MQTPLPQIILGISGSIAAYKTPELVRLLKKKGFGVWTVLSQGGSQFVTPTTLESVSENPVITTLFPGKPDHIQLNKIGTLLVVAPATANMIAKFACGIADDALTTTFLTFEGPKLIVPAMHTEMINNPIVAENCQKLRKMGIQFLGPETGDLLCKDMGKGRMSEPATIVQKIESMMFPPLNLSGKKIVVSAGGTQEPIDAVRVITNLSTGKLGHTLAKFAAFYGADVTLITTKDDLYEGIQKVIQVRTVEEMKVALMEQMKDTDIVIMAAAVSDFKPEFSAQKLTRSGPATLQLTATSDILFEIGQAFPHIFKVGFCLETENLEAKAKEKMDRKKVEMIVANTPTDIGSGTRTLTIYTKTGKSKRLEALPLPETCYELLSFLSAEESD